MSISAMMMVQAAEARRRRDEQGRYMGSTEPDMRHEPRRGEMARNYPRADDDDGEEMRARERRPRMDYGRQPERQERRRDMGGEGYVVWDNAQQPYMPPERYGQPESRRDEWETRNNVTDMRQYRKSMPHSTMGHRWAAGKDDEARGGEEEKPTIGFGAEHEKNKLDRHQAEKWVHSMSNADGSRGGKWRMEEVQQVARNFGIQDGQEMIDFFAIINAMRSNFGEVAKQFGVDKMDFYAALAKAWLRDEDAVEDKAAAYYKHVTRHGS